MFAYFSSLHILLNFYKMLLENKISYRFYTFSKDLYFYKSLHLLLKFLYLQSKNGLQMLCYRLSWKLCFRTWSQNISFTTQKYSEVRQRLTYPSLVSIVETNVPLNQYRQMVWQYRISFKTWSSFETFKLFN